MSTLGMAPEFWSPDSGRRSACHTWKSVANGQTEVPATLGPLGSVFGKSFELPESWAGKKRLILELGDLAEIAEVTLNGKRLGLVWLPPYRIEITGALHAGSNPLEVRVANLWANRLNGDSLRPESDRFTHSNLDRMQTDPTSDSWYGRVPAAKRGPFTTRFQR